ncbi:MAG: hypothetical protein ACLS61_11155 [Ruminococcus sp.]
MIQMYMTASAIKTIGSSDGARIGYYGGDALDGSNTAVLAPKITGYK